MAFFDFLKRKPGGTLVGNFLRSASKAVANAIVPGAGALVGNGAMMISQEDADKRDLSDSDFLAKYGVTKTGYRPPTPQPLQPQIMSIQQSMDINDANRFKQVNKQSFKDILKKYWWAFAIPLVGIITLLFFAFRKKRRK